MLEISLAPVPMKMWYILTKICLHRNRKAHVAIILNVVSIRAIAFTVNDIITVLQKQIISEIFCIFVVCVLLNEYDVMERNADIEVSILKWACVGAYILEALCLH